MPKSARTKAAAVRASFGRAERLQREAGVARPAKSGPSRKQPLAAHAVAAPKREIARGAPSRPITAFTAAARIRERDVGHVRQPTVPGVAMKRAERSREIADRQRHQRVKEQTRSTFNRDADRRQDLDRRAEHERKRQHVQAIVRRFEDSRKRTMQRQAERKRADMRRSFAAAGKDRQAIEAAARQKEMERRAAAEIERDHKRRAADQQTEHRRQTSEVRARHQVETRSFRSNEDAAMERHHHAIKGLDDREARALHDYDGRRNGLAGRIAERLPGRRAENDRQRDAIVKGFEAERLTKHRDFEALKERQFEIAQRSRLQQAQDRKALMTLHRDDRARLQQDYTRDRPMLIDGRARVLERVELAREREREHAHERPEPGREVDRVTDRPTVAFAWAAVRMDAQPSSGSAHERVEPIQPEHDRPALSRDDGREFERSFHAFGRA